jgi:hypothetical protein
MRNNELKLSSTTWLLAAEYRHLITLPVLSDPEADRLAEILEIASFNESLNCLIEEIEMSDYLEFKQNKGLKHLLKLVSTGLLAN